MESNGWMVVSLVVCFHWPISPTAWPIPCRKAVQALWLPYCQGCGGIIVTVTSSGRVRLSPRTATHQLWPDDDVLEHATRGTMLGAKEQAGQEKMQKKTTTTTTGSRKSGRIKSDKIKSGSSDGSCLTMTGVGGLAFADGALRDWQVRLFFHPRWIRRRMGGRCQFLPTEVQFLRVEVCSRGCLPTKTSREGQINQSTALTYAFNHK